jgi:hypothetical protein
VTIRLTYAVRYDTFALYSIEPGLKEKGVAMGLPARGWKWRKGKAWRAGLWLHTSILEADRVAAELGIKKETLE